MHFFYYALAWHWSNSTALYNVLLIPKSTKKTNVKNVIYSYILQIMNNWKSYANW